MATIDLGKIALVWKGTYAAGTTYESKDVVQYTDSGEVSSYIYVNASGASGQTPSTGGTVNTTYWNKMAGGAAGIWASGLALGSAGQVVKVNSGATALEFASDSGGLKSQQVFTASGTWTKPSGINLVKVYVTGAGGGGGGTDNDDMANGGGAGGTAIKIIDVTSVSSVAVTVGSGSAGSGNGSSNSSSRGGTSSFGSYCSSTGGDRAGGNWALGGDGGTATGGDINLSGSDGHGGMIDNTGNNQAAGTGGASYWGQGGKGATRNSDTAMAPGQAYGSGGGGGANTQTSASGAGGIVVVEEYA